MKSKNKNFYFCVQPTSCNLSSMRVPLCAHQPLRVLSNLQSVQVDSWTRMAVSSCQERPGGSSQRGFTVERPEDGRLCLQNKGWKASCWSVLLRLHNTHRVIIIIIESVKQQCQCFFMFYVIYHVILQTICCIWKTNFFLKRKTDNEMIVWGPDLLSQQTLHCID